MPSSLIQTRVRSTSLWFSLLRSSEFQFSRQLMADTTEVVERPYSSDISVVVIGGVWPPSNDRWLPIGVRVPRRLLSTCLHWTLIEKPDNAANKRSSNNWTWLEDIQLHTHCCLSQVQLSLLLLRDCVVVSPPPRNGQMKIIQKKMMGYQSTLAKFYIAAGMAHQASAAGPLFLAEPDLG